MKFRIRMQFDEAFGCLNRWFCSQANRKEITDPEILIQYFILSGGADDFRRRYTEAMSALNRWYCSEFYGYEVHDPETLWDYYMNHREAEPLGLRKRSVAC